jgi:CHASE1-domain containing sensor protein
MGRYKQIGVLKVFIGTVLISVSLHSCVYFNTLYNARRYFRDAEELREKDPSGRAVKDNYLWARPWSGRGNLSRV